jgi:AcrR family transcriptional regulator
MNRHFDQSPEQPASPPSAALDVEAAAASPGPRANGRPTRACAEEIRSAILDAAMVEFTERDFHGGSIARIAERANVTRATIYHHFSSKEAILEKLCEHTTGRLRSAIDEVINAHRPAQEVLQDVARCLCKDGVSTDARSVSRILVMESDRFPELVRKGYELRWLALEPLSNYFETLSMNGEMTLDDAPRAAQQFMHLVSNSVESLFADDAMSWNERERWISFAVLIFLNGVLRAS